MRSSNTFVLWVALLLVAAGCYGGNAIIGVGQGLLVAAVIGALFLKPDWKDGLGKNWKMPFSAWMLLAVIGVSFLSIVANLDSYDNPVRDGKKLRHLLIPLLLLWVPSIRQRILGHAPRIGQWVWKVLLVVAMVVTIADAINLITGFHPLLPTDNPNRYDRLGGIFGMVMTYGYSMQFTVLVVIAAAWLLITRKWSPDKWTYWLTLVSVVVLGLGLFFSGTRGAMLGVGIGGLVLLFLTRSKWLYLGATGAVVVGLIFLIATDSRFLKMKGNDSARIAQWKTAMVTGIKNPVLGIGYRQFEKQCVDLKREYGFPYDALITREVNGERVAKEGWINSNAHNNLLEAFASTGVFGFLVLAGFLLGWLREVWQQKDTRIIFGPAIIGFLVAGSFENSFTDGEITTLVMLFYVTSQFMIIIGSDRENEEVVA